MNEFYTYMYLRENGVPLYVGKGSGNRAFHHHRRIPVPPRDRIIVQMFETEQDAFEAECLLISIYGRKDLGTGSLLNRSDGGEGPAGQVISQETIEKRRAKIVGRKKRPHSLETRQKLSERLKSLGIQPSVEAREKARQQNIGKKWGPEFGQKVSAALTGRVFTPEWRANLSAAQKRRFARSN